MDQKAVRSWVMYDWANSAYYTTMVSAVLPIFYLDVAAATIDKNLAQSYWGYTQSISMLFVAIMSPILGAIADLSGSKVRFLRVFTYLGILGSVLFVCVGEGNYLLASLLVILGTIGVSGGNVFYDALLPNIAPQDKRDMVSSRGYAYGYIGGGILLAINLAWIQGYQVFGLPNKTAGTYLSFISVGVWWFLFSLPLFRHMKDTRIHTGLSLGGYVNAGVGRVWQSMKQITKYPELLKFLIAFWFFNDGIGTIITMATVYGHGIGIGTTDLIIALLITQFVGVPFTMLFGKIAERIGSKPSLYISLSVYVCIVFLGFFMSNAWHFYALAILVGCVQGGSQAISRSIYSSLVPQDRTGEFFGFLSVSSKFASIFGPFTFAVVGQLTGSPRLGILSLLLFFVVGIGLLTRVNITKGRSEADSPPVAPGGFTAV